MTNPTRIRIPATEVRVGDLVHVMPNTPAHPVIEIVNRSQSTLEFKFAEKPRKFFRKASTVEVTR